MLANLRLRLLREMPWKSADDLAQEIFAALSDEETPQDIPEGIKLTSNDNKVPIEITDFGTGDESPLMQFNRGNDSFALTINNGALQFGPLGNTVPVNQGGSASSAATMFPGQVVASLGGNRYTMRVFPNGRSKASVNVTADQLEGDPDFPHAIGRWTFVLKEADNTYSMIIPVWG